MRCAARRGRCSWSPGDASPGAGAVEPPTHALWTGNGRTETTCPSSTVYTGGSLTPPRAPHGQHGAFRRSGGGSAGSGLPRGGRRRLRGGARRGGRGGWISGGAFTREGGLARTNAAHILSDGRVSGREPLPNGEAPPWAAAGPAVYAGGSFTSIGGQPRSRIAALDASTGTATAWNPNANSVRHALAVSGSTVYAGGGFTSIGGQTRNRIAALDAATGNATAWNPNANNYGLRPGGLGLDRLRRRRFHHRSAGEPATASPPLDAATGTATSWNPNANGSVRPPWPLAARRVYAGGGFTSIGGQTRNYIAALDATTGTATSWNPNANDCLRPGGVGHRLRRRQLHDHRRAATIPFRRH